MNLGKQSNNNNMNKNRKRIVTQNRKDGNLVPYVHKAKKQKFPQPKDAGLSLHAQREMLPNYK